MATKTYAGLSIDITEDGYLTNPAQWTPAVAGEIAQEEGIMLTQQHHAVLQFIRERTLKGENLSLRSIGKSGVVDTKGFYELFPGAPLKKACRIAGIPKPSSCV